VTFWGTYQVRQVKHDRVAEVLTIAIAADLRLDLLDLRVHRFAQRIGGLQHDRVDDAVSMSLKQHYRADHSDRWFNIAAHFQIHAR